MNAVRPTRLAFRGRVEASGVLLADSDEGRRRALACWSPGTELRRGPRGLLVRFATPQRMLEEAAPGAVLVAQHGVWASAPLTTSEAEGFAPAAVLVAQGGALLAVEAPTPVDASEWLDVAAFSVVPAEPLPEPPRPIAVAAEAPRVDLRARVKDPATKQAVLDALRDSGAVRPPPRWKRWFKRAKRSDGAGGTAKPPNALDRMNAWLSKRLEATKVGRWMIDRQSAYFDRLSKMFDDDLDEALKHAIALEGDSAGAHAGRSLQMPTPRAGLGMTFGAGTGTGPAIQMEGDRYARLRAQYREAAKKLEAEGRIEEAAFVLTDLLNAPADAVDLLYRHRKYALAAQLAESKSMEPALVVRLWFLAGDPARAVRIARKTKSFATAISKLEGHPEAALKLRMMWADALAAGGDFAAAVHAAFNVPEARPLVLKWLDLALDGGGVEAVKLAVMRLDLAPHEPDAVTARVHALLDDPSPERAAERSALGEALLIGNDASRAQRLVLGRAAVRALVRDRALHGVKTEPLVRRLLQLDEGALRTDVPATFPPAPPRQRPSDFGFRADAAGVVALDAAMLPGGKVLVALGDNGLSLLAPDGRAVWHDDGPAFALAVAPAGGFAVSLTPRGEAVNLARVSVALRKVEDWARVPLAAAAAEVHQGLWLVASGGAVLALDALTTPASALWQYPFGASAVLAVCAEPNGHAMLLQEAAGAQLYQFAVPRNLAQPVGPMWVGPGRVQHAACGFAGFACVGTNVAGQPRAWVLTPGANQVAEQVLDGPPAGAPAVTAGRVAISTRVRDGVRVAVTPGVLRLHFDGATRAALRFHGDVLVVTADNGRVVAFDCAETTVLRQLSVRVGR